MNWSNNPNYQDPVSSKRIHNIKIDTEPRDTLPNSTVTRNIPISRDSLPGPDSKVTTTVNHSLNLFQSEKSHFDQNYIYCCFFYSVH